MISLNRRPLLWGRQYFLLVIGHALLLIGNVSGQEKERYFLSDEGQLEMIVYVIGEVKKPGEYRVVDTTNLIELISKAEGPTAFSKLSAVSITRNYHDNMLAGNNGSSRSLRRTAIIRYDLDQYLKRSTAIQPPILKPGDVVVIPRNSWHRWRNVFTVVRDLSVIASVYLLYLRATRNGF